MSRGDLTGVEWRILKVLLPIVFRRDAVKQITKLTDGDGQYLWRQSVREGERKAEPSKIDAVYANVKELSEACRIEHRRTVLRR